MNRACAQVPQFGPALWIVAQVKIVVILTGIYAVGFAVSRVPWWLAVAKVCG